MKRCLLEVSAVCIAERPVGEHRYYARLLRTCQHVYAFCLYKLKMPAHLSQDGGADRDVARVGVHRGDPQPQHVRAVRRFLQEPASISQSLNPFRQQKQRCEQATVLLIWAAWLCERTHGNQIRAWKFQ